MGAIRDEHIEILMDVLVRHGLPELESHYIARNAIRQAVAATELAINADAREREETAARRKQDARLAMFHRPGRFGHG
jgi:hypothetical protein